MRGAWIQTFGGGQFFFNEPREGEFNAEAVAHSLSCINRFTGHASRPYNVAEHSVRVSLYAAQLVADKSPEHIRMVAQWGLIHDVSESVTNDLNSPLKHGTGLEGFRKIEADIMKRVCEWLGLPLEMPPEVKTADEHVLFGEIEALMAPVHPQWRTEYGDAWCVAPNTLGIHGMGWRESRGLFLSRFKYLFGGLR